MKKSQQEWVKDVIFHIIQTMNKYNGDMSTTGYTYGIKGFIDQYSIILRTKDDENISLFQSYLSNFKKGYFEHVLMSKAAYEILRECAEGKLKMTSEQLKKKLHGEHMTPMAYTRLHLNELVKNKNTLSKEEIKKGIDYAFTHAKYCLITKEESVLLDGKGCVFSSEEIRDFLKVYKTIHPNLSQKEENDYIELKGKKKSCFGFGAIRLFALQKSKNPKVVFVDSKGNTKGFSECVANLEDENHNV